MGNKANSLTALDVSVENRMTASGSILQDNGSPFPEIYDLIRECEQVGATRKEINAVLAKYLLGEEGADTYPNPKKAWAKAS